MGDEKTRLKKAFEQVAGELRQVQDNIKAREEAINTNVAKIRNQGTSDEMKRSLEAQNRDHNDALARLKGEEDELKAKKEEIRAQLIRIGEPDPGMANPDPEHRAMLASIKAMLTRPSPPVASFRDQPETEGLSAETLAALEFEGI